jgi:peptide-methionine (S)-S-oxide reductase
MDKNNKDSLDYTPPSSPSPQEETATLAGGCFWCLEAVFDELDGVLSVESGYTGGHFPNPTYEQVCGGATGHAEAVQVTFDPAVLSYHDLLTIFFTLHDPTTPNRQGNDVGSQYRSAIFHHNEEQKRTAEQVMKDVETARIWDNPLVTELTAFEQFHPAEDYHQEYFVNNPFQMYCRVVVAPKVAKFRQKFAERLKKTG